MSPLMELLVRRTLEIIRSSGLETDSGGHEPFMSVIENRVWLTRPQFVQYARQALRR